MPKQGKITVKEIINGIYFSYKDDFITPKKEIPYYKRTNTTTYKIIKVYAKGLQFANNPEYNVNINTLRFEIKSKQSKYIRTQGINTIQDLLTESKYHKFSDTLLKEWDKVLLTNLILNECKEQNLSYWQDLINHKNRNLFNISKQKYYSKLLTKNNLHFQVKLNLIDKLNDLVNNANSTQRTLINTRKNSLEQTTSQLINLESAQLRYCKVTGLNISAQKESSKFLGENTLKGIKINQPDIYLMLEKKYLKKVYKTAPEKRQLYLICKNIRDIDSNKRNNRLSFEKRNYNQNQLQFQF